MDYLLLWIDRCRDVAEDRLDLRFNLVNIDVSHNYYSLHVRSAPSLVEVGKAFVLECLELLLTADECSLCIWSVTIIIRKRLLEHSPACISSGASFLEDHASFRIDLLRVVGNEMRVIMKDKKT